MQYKVRQAAAGPAGARAVEKDPHGSTHASSRSSLGIKRSVAVQQLKFL